MDWELEIMELTDRPVMDGNESVRLLGIVATLLLDIRDGQVAPKPPAQAPQLVGRTPHENWG